MQLKLKIVTHKTIAKKVKKQGLKGEAGRFIGTKWPRHLYAGIEALVKLIYVNPCSSLFFILLTYLNYLLKQVLSTFDTYKTDVWHIIFYKSKSIEDGLSAWFILTNKLIIK